MVGARGIGHSAPVSGDPTGGRRPWITANQVTVARLLPMPLVTYLIYRGPAHWWPPLLLAAVIGGTDYLDGYLARKQGPTLLGGLLDPIADKVFIALIYLPLMDLGFLPTWVVGLMFVREFLVTGMRSAYAYRGVTFATSYLAKLKTWVQMQGIGLLVLVYIVSRPVMWTLLVIQLVIPALVVAIVWFARKQSWKSGWMTLLFIGILTGLYATGDVELTVLGAMLTITVLTWASGLDYLVGGLARLRAAQPWGRADGVRVVAGLVLPLALIGALGHSPAPAAPLLAVVALELSVGGLDNLLAAHKAYASARWWGVRTLGVALLAGAALLAVPLAQPWLAVAGPWAAVALSLSLVAREFWRGRGYYLDRRVRHAA